MAKKKSSEKVTQVQAFIKKYEVVPTVLEYDLGNNEVLKITVTPKVSFAESAQLIKSIADMAFVNGGNSIEDYTPNSLEFAIRAGVITAFTDFKLPEDINESWEVLTQTPLFDDVMRVLNECNGDIQNVLDSVDRLVETKRAYLVNNTNINELVKTITDAFNNFAEQVNIGDVKSLMAIVDKFPNDLSAEDIVQAIQNIEENKTENK